MLLSDGHTTTLQLDAAHLGERKGQANNPFEALRYRKGTH